MTISRCDGESGIIRIVAAVVTGPDGRTLLVRKRGTEAFMQVGGKVAAGEAPIEALAREVDEELGCALKSYSDMGVFRAPAANEPGFTVHARLYAATLLGTPAPKGEIEEIAWLDPDRESALTLAPLTRCHALPIARACKEQFVL